jgi:hypothetical protein
VYSNLASNLASNLTLGRRYARESQGGVISRKERKALGLKRGRRDDGSFGWTSRRASRLAFRVANLRAGLHECPKCETFVAPSEVFEERTRCDCPRCGLCYCSKCKKPYHYRTRCDEVAHLARHWMQWRQVRTSPGLDIS